MRGYNSTIQRKKKKCIVCGDPCFIFSHGRCEQCARVANAEKNDAKQDTDEAESVAILKKDADLLFSRVIRLRAAAPGTGLLSCFICDATVHYSLAHAMHFEGRADSSLRFHPKNVRAGCFNCNVALEGNLDKYAERLNAEEPRLSEWLEAEGRPPYKFWRTELKIMIGDLSREINHLKKIKGLK